MKYVEMYENSRSLARGRVGHRGISTDNTDNHNDVTDSDRADFCR